MIINASSKHFLITDIYMKISVQNQTLHLKGKTYWYLVNEMYVHFNLLVFKKYIIKQTYESFIKIGFTFFGGKKKRKIRSKTCSFAW